MKIGSSLCKKTPSCSSDPITNSKIMNPKFSMKTKIEIRILKVIITISIMWVLLSWVILISITKTWGLPYGEQKRLQNFWVYGFTSTKYFLFMRCIFAKFTCKGFSNVMDIINVFVLFMYFNLQTSLCKLYIFLLWLSELPISH